MIVAAVALPLLLATALCVYVGLRIGQRQLAHHAEVPSPGTSAVQAAMLGLVGLLLSFTVSAAAQRFDSRRVLVVDEANAIGTAYLRIDLLPADAQRLLRGLFRAYVDSRIAAYRKIPDLAAVSAEMARTEAIKGQIWAAAVPASRADPSFAPAAILVLPALNQMFDLGTMRNMVSRLHPPLLIFVMLVVVVLVCSLYVGHAMSRDASRSWIHIVGFVFLIVFVLVTILDLEYPRIGFLREVAFDRALVDVRATMTR